MNGVVGEIFVFLLILSAIVTFIAYCTLRRGK